MSSEAKKYKNWSRNSKAAKDLIKEFEKFKATGGKEGISTEITNEQITSLYNNTPALAEYNPRYFQTNFGSLVTWYNTNYALTGARSKFFIFFPFLFLEIIWLIS